MPEKHALSLFIFRRDLRTEDNTALNAALRESKNVALCFILDPKQVGDNEYKSENAIQFMAESLRNLAQHIERKSGILNIFYGSPEKVLDTLFSEITIDAVYVNEDYTPFSSARDKALRELCERRNVAFAALEDALLLSPKSFSKPDGTPYTVFTPFFKRGSLVDIRKPSGCNENKFYPIPLPGASTDAIEKIAASRNTSLAVHGGRDEALKIIEALPRKKNYDAERDIPSLSGTTRLSPHHKFGTVSVREVYYSVKAALGVSHTLIRELFWRDFFTHIGYHFPRVFGGAFHSKYDTIAWENDAEKFELWRQGRTGFPIVDAGMRELNETGFMHNRVRMIVASFLTKDLLIDWRWGEKYFAQKLVDYDPAVNNGNWQWAASTGCDAQPYFRIFNPWLQQEKFDKDCAYIKHWVPELKKLAPKTIHRLYDEPLFAGDYPRPCVVHAESKIAALAMYQEAAEAHK